MDPEMQKLVFTMPFLEQQSVFKIEEFEIGEFRDERNIITNPRA